jgi:hypothetical protein
VSYRPVRDLSVSLEMVAVWRQGEKSPVRERFVTALRAVARARSRSTVPRATIPDATTGRATTPRAR